MPELPEVNFVSNALDKIIAGRKIIDARLIRARLAPDTDSSTFAAELSGATVRVVHRRGKHILIELNNDRTLLTHLRMSGRFLLLGEENEDPKFAHAVFYFEDGGRLVFDDQRHFGLMKILKTEQVSLAKEISKLAPEPFSDEFSTEYLRNKLKASKRSIKETLLDQTKICGLGNIYASEALFLSGIDPRKRSHRISGKRADILHEMIRRVLNEAISLGETITVVPENISGSIYGAGSESAWRVYDREDRPCPGCKHPIARITQAGRSSYFCRRCQRS